MDCAGMVDVKEVQSAIDRTGPRAIVLTWAKERTVRLGSNPARPKDTAAGTSRRH